MRACQSPGPGTLPVILRQGHTRRESRRTRILQVPSDRVVEINRDRLEHVAALGGYCDRARTGIAGCVQGSDTMLRTLERNAGKQATGRLWIEQQRIERVL